MAKGKYARNVEGGECRRIYSGENIVNEVHLDFQLYKDSLQEISKFRDSPYFRREFIGTPKININGTNIFQSNLLLPEEILEWLYWLDKEKQNYSNPKQFHSGFPEDFLKIERATKLPKNTKRNKKLMEWANGHVLMHYLGEAPYLTLQSPSGTELEIFWDFINPSYTYQQGRKIVAKERFLEEVERQRKNLADIIFRKFSDFKKRESLKFLL